MSRLLSAVVLLSPLTAQSGATPVQIHGHGPGDEQVLFDAPGDGSQWAVTARYKAGFDSEGMQFVPFLGSQAERNFPVRFTLAGAYRTDGELPLAAVRAPVRHGKSVDLDHGSLIERYEVGLQGVEQTFVLGAPLPGNGDLVLRVRVTTELEPDQGSGGLSFRNELGRVGYGAAFVRDAVSANKPVAQRFDGDCIELRVPAATLAGATYPITIDPLVAAFPVTAQPIVEHRPDIAWDAIANRYCVVWEQDFSATDHDVWSQLFDVSGAPVQNGLQAIDATTSNWTRPRCAVTTGYVLTVAARGPVGRRQVWGRQLYVPQPGVIGNPFLIAVNHVGTSEVYNADVGGATPMIGGGSWLVVYEQSVVDVGRSIIGQRIQNGQLNGASFVIEPFGDAHNPAVARSTGDVPSNDAGWPVVWQRTTLRSDDDIWGTVVAASQGVNPPFAIDTSTRHDTNPVVSSIADPIPGGQRLFLVAWEGQVGASDHDIFVRAMSVAGNLSIGPTNVSALDAGSRARDQVLPHLDCDGSRFALACAEAQDAQNLDICMWTLGINNGQSLSVSEGRTSIASSAQPETGPRVFANHSAEPFDSSARYAVVWEQAGDVVAARYDGFGNGGYSLRPTGCSQLGMTYGSRPVIGGSISAALQNAGGDACLMAVSAPVPSQALGCGTCQLGIDLNGALILATRGVSFPVPNDSVYVGLQVSVQGAAIGTGGYPCIDSQVRFSDTVDITIQ
jgi:hypothetical protein